MDIADLKSKIKNAYASFESYEDSGTFESGASYHTGGWFRTFFIGKPRQLLFEWSPKEGDDSKHVFMVKGDKAQLLQTKEMKERYVQGKFNFVPKEQFKQLEVVGKYSDIAPGLRGITHTVSDFVVRTLATDKCSWTSEKYALMQDAVLNGESCYKLRKIYEPEIVWISKDDFTVRRCELDGMPILNASSRFLIMGSAKLFDLFSKKNRTDEAREFIERNMKTVVWTFKKVRYNHLTKENFPKFEFRELSR